MDDQQDKNTNSMESAKHRIAVLGLGGGGGKIAAILARNQASGPLEVAIADTDLNALNSIVGPSRIPLGQEWTRREGCGGDVVLGERAASASAAELKEFIADARLLVVVAALGKGTGSGSVKVVARLAREMEVTAIFFVTLPFAFEGNWCAREAEKSLAALRSLTDTVVTVPNDTLFTALPANTSAAEAFTLADPLLASGIAGLMRITSAQGLVTADFAAFSSLLRQRHATCALGIGTSTEEANWQEALDAFLQSPFIRGNNTLANADAAVITLLVDTNLSLGDMQECLTTLQKQFRPEARLVVGAYCNDQLQEHVQLTGLICKYQDIGASRTDATPQQTDTSQRTKGKPRKGKAKTQDLQQELPLQEQSLGIFSSTAPTTLRGENLDIPTFQRRGIQLEID